MKIKNLVGRKFSTLSQSEKEFYWELEIGILNTAIILKLLIIQMILFGLLMGMT